MMTDTPPCLLGLDDEPDTQPYVSQTDKRAHSSDSDSDKCSPVSSCLTVLLLSVCYTSTILLLSFCCLSAALLLSVCCPSAVRLLPFCCPSDFNCCCSDMIDCCPPANSVKAKLLLQMKPPKKRKRVSVESQSQGLSQELSQEPGPSVSQGDASCSTVAFLTHASVVVQSYAIG